jgi:hypothetical protein
MNSRLLSLNHPSAMVSSLAGTLRRNIFALLRLHPWCPLPSKQLRILIRKLVSYGLPQHSLSAGLSFVGSTALASELMLLGQKYATGVIVTQVVPAVDGHSSVVLDYKSALAKYFPGEPSD